MRSSKYIPHYLDGYLIVYRPKEEANKSIFGAKTNVKNTKDMDQIYKLAYRQSYKRLQDLEFAESSGRSLTLKLKTRLVNGIKNTDKVVINNVLYDIIHTDEDLTNRELFFYLEEAYTIE